MATELAAASWTFRAARGAVGREASKSGRGQRCEQKQAAASCQGSDLCAVKPSAEVTAVMQAALRPRASPWGVVLVPQRHRATAYVRVWLALMLSMCCDQQTYPPLCVLQQAVGQHQ
jgi:hypothetical protein